MSKDAKILIVEDEQHINRLIELVLMSDGFYNIKKAFDGSEALDIIKTEKPDLILLDVMLPETDGLEVCRIIKNNPVYKSIPVIMLTARKMEEDVLRGFECGAVDYVTKPFSNKILLARINAHLSNVSISTEKIYKSLILNSEKRTVNIGDIAVNLTNFEFEILENFISNPGRVYTRSQLLSYLRGADGFEVSERAVDVQILNLRRKLRDMGECIETVRGVGYKLRESENE